MLRVVCFCVSVRLSLCDIHALNCACIVVPNVGNVLSLNKNAFLLGKKLMRLLYITAAELDVGGLKLQEWTMTE